MEKLDRLFTRFLRSAAQYVLTAEPYVTPGDESLLDSLRELADEDLRLAARVAKIADGLDAVPQAGPFPYWYEDLNYLSVPWLGGFVVRALDEDLDLLDSILAEWSGDATVLEGIRAERRVARDRLFPAVDAAIARESRALRTGIEKVRAAREARARAAEAEKEAAKARAAEAKAAAKAKTAAKAAPAGDPELSPKERARQAILARRQAAAATKAAAVPDGPDPDEPGISAKEKARRQILRMRAQKKRSDPDTLGS